MIYFKKGSPFTLTIITLVTTLIKGCQSMGFDCEYKNSK